MRTISSAVTPRPTLQRKFLQIHKDRELYILILPAVIYFAVFKIWPILEMKLAFYDYHIMGDNVFAGLKYFKMLFSTPIFPQVIANTFIISGMKIFLTFPFPIMFAILLNFIRNKYFRQTAQVLAYMPHFLSWVVVAGLWYEILSPSNGIINLIITSLGGSSIDFLTSKTAIRWVLLVSTIWRSAGWDSIIYFTAILQIDPALYEAAEIDGASRIQVIRYILLPALYEPMITVLILNTGFIMSSGMDQILNFMNPSVLSTIDVLDTYVYRMGLLNSQYSFATAAALFKGVVGSIFMLGTHYTSKRLTGKGAW